MLYEKFAKYQKKAPVSYIEDELGSLDIIVRRQK